jgi:hypothetical protein
VLFRSVTQKISHESGLDGIGIDNRELVDEASAEYGGKHHNRH